MSCVLAGSAHAAPAATQDIAGTGSSSNLPPELRPSNCFNYDLSKPCPPATLLQLLGGIILLAGSSES